MADNETVARCEESRWYRRYQRAFVFISVGGGLLMLLGAAVAHDSASIPLLVIGGAWTVMGAAGAAQRRRVFTSAQFENGVLTLVSPSEEARVAADDILEIRRSRGDINRFSPLQVRTRSHGTMRLSPRLNGLIELLVDLRAANPGMRVGNL